VVSNAETDHLPGIRFLTVTSAQSRGCAAIGVDTPFASPIAVVVVSTPHATFLMKPISWSDA
jgi:hypothetical protein